MMYSFIQLRTPFMAMDDEIGLNLNVCRLYACIFTSYSNILEKSGKKYLRFTNTFEIQFRTVYIQNTVDFTRKIK